VHEYDHLQALVESPEKNLGQKRSSTFLAPSLQELYLRKGQVAGQPLRGDL